MDALDRRPGPGIKVSVLFQVFGKRLFETGPGWYQDQKVEVETAVAKYGGDRRPITLVDEKVGRPDEDCQLVVRSRPWLPMNPGHQGRVDALDLVLHFTDDRTARAG